MLLDVLALFYSGINVNNNYERRYIKIFVEAIFFLHEILLNKRELYNTNCTGQRAYVFCGMAAPKRMNILKIFALWMNCAN